MYNHPLAPQGKTKRRDSRTDRRCVTPQSIGPIRSAAEVYQVSAAREEPDSVGAEGWWDRLFGRAFEVSTSVSSTVPTVLSWKAYCDPRQ